MVANMEYPRNSYRQYNLVFAIIFVFIFKINSGLIAQMNISDSIVLKKLSDSTIAYLGNPDKAIVFIEQRESLSKKTEHWFNYLCAISDKIEMYKRIPLTDSMAYYLNIYTSILPIYKIKLTVSEYIYLNNFIYV